MLFWLTILIYYGLFEFVRGVSSFWPSLYYNAIFLPHDMIMTYLFIYWLIPNFFFHRKYLMFFFILTSMLLVNMLLSYFIYILLIDPDYFNAEKNRLIEFLFLSNMSFVFVLSLAQVMKSININNLRLLQKEQAESRFHQAEIALLRSQINPHFLYNTLNNINTLVFIDQQKTYDSIIKLSEIMRHMQEGQTAEFVPLENELAYMSNYVELQKLRFRKEHSVQMTFSVKNPEILLAPMLLVGFIENAFKHCNRKEMTPAILIDLRSDDTGISLSVKNHYSPRKDIKNSSPGFGLENTRQRLDLLYPDNHELYIKDTGDFFEIELKLGPIERNK